MMPTEDIIIAVIMLAGAIGFFFAHKKQKKKDAEKIRRKLLKTDYPEIVSKILVYLGAGMSIRTAWDRIVINGNLLRPAYQEMEKTNEQLKNGMGEIQALREFGRSCREKSYMKLSGLLTQSQKIGIANLNALLSIEVTEAWEERKGLAKRTCEEAETKLLLPLIMMLFVVLIIIMVPAMSSMNL